MTTPGGFELRRLEAELELRLDPTEVVLRHRRAQLLADFVRDNVALRLPLPDILTYARDWTAMYGWPRVRDRLYALVNDHRGDHPAVPPE